MSTDSPHAGLILQINPGADFTAEGLAETIRLNKERLIYGDLDRVMFSELVFQFGDLSRLPIGHLQDHRIVMPESMIESVMLTKAATIDVILKNMLHGSNHSEAAPIIEHALGRDPRADAILLQKLCSESPTLFRTCLEGRFPKAIEAAGKGGSSRLKTLVASTVELLLIYYCALQLQLIAAYLKAIDEYSLLPEQEGHRTTASKTVGDIQDILSGFLATQIGLDLDGLEVGRQERTISILRAIGEKIEGGLSPELAAEIQLVAKGRSSAFLEHIPGMKEILDNLESTRGTSRTLLSSITGNASAGVKLAFASLRMIALARDGREMVNLVVSDNSAYFNHWLLKSLRKTNRPNVSRLLFVHRVVGLGDSQAGVAFNENGEVPLNSQMTHSDPKRLVGEDIIRAALKGAESWQAARKSVKAGELVGAQVWDILPDYYFSFDSISPRAKPDTAPAKKGYVQKLHQPSPVRKAPKRAPRA